MKIDSKFRYIYILELSPKEYSLLCEAMKDLENIVMPHAEDEELIKKMWEQLSEYRVSSEARVRVVA